MCADLFDLFYVAAGVVPKHSIAGTVDGVVAGARRLLTRLAVGAAARRAAEATVARGAVWAFGVVDARQ